MCAHKVELGRRLSWFLDLCQQPVKTVSATLYDLTSAGDVVAPGSWWGCCSGSDALVPVWTPCRRGRLGRTRGRPGIAVLNGSSSRTHSPHAGYQSAWNETRHYAKVPECSPVSTLPALGTLSDSLSLLTPETICPRVGGNLDVRLRVCCCRPLPVRGRSRLLCLWRVQEGGGEDFTMKIIRIVRGSVLSACCGHPRLRFPGPSAGKEEGAPAQEALPGAVRRRRASPRCLLGGAAVGLSAPSNALSPAARE